MGAIEDNFLLTRLVDWSMFWLAINCQGWHLFHSAILVLVSLLVLLHVSQII